LESFFSKVRIVEQKLGVAMEEYEADVYKPEESLIKSLFCVKKIMQQRRKKPNPLYQRKGVLSVCVQ
jgi:hypothetical protein